MGISQVKRYVCAAAIAVAAVFYVSAAPAGDEAAVSAPSASGGWASYTGSKDLANGGVVPPDAKIGTTGGASADAAHTFTVSDRASLLKAMAAAKKAPSIIYIDGMIDMTDGMLPSSGTTSTAGLDSFIAKTSADAAFTNKLTAEYVVKSYADWKKLYGAKVVSTDDASGSIRTMQRALSEAWGKQIRIDVPS